MTLGVSGSIPLSSIKGHRRRRFFQVGSFYFPNQPLLVVDFEADPRDSLRFRKIILRCVSPDELALLSLDGHSFRTRRKIGQDVDFEAELREIELLLNRDPSTNFSPTITIDPNPERFTDEPALACLPPPGE
ncbi:hypothetical protein Tco_1547562 [Tanacetum coccineum]|uniref:Uncharacterized protein n=1 Tax=Tanacetum coccineum TaxID=301880 RepID=A0ABQ5EUS7_9ASTR